MKLDPIGGIPQGTIALEIIPIARIGRDGVPPDAGVACGVEVVVVTAYVLPAVADESAGRATA